MPKSIQCGFGAGGPVPAPHMLVLYGPTLVVDIGFDPAHIPGASTSPTLAEKGLPALVDTGASDSFIDVELAARLRLPVVDRKHVSGSAGRHEVDIHVAHIHVPAIGLTVFGRFGSVHLAAGGQRHSALIGRAFLTHFQMIYDGVTGAVELILP